MVQRVEARGKMENNVDIDAFMERIVDWSEGRRVYRRDKTLILNFG
jgi:hypothetical protein